MHRFITVGIFVTFYAIFITSFGISEDSESNEDDIIIDSTSHIYNGSQLQVKGCVMPGYSKAFNRALKKLGVRIDESIVRFIDIKDVKKFRKNWIQYKEGLLDYDYDEPINGKYEKMAPILFESCPEDNFETCACSNINDYVNYKISTISSLLRFSSAFKNLQVYKGKIRSDEESSNTKPRSVKNEAQLNGFNDTGGQENDVYRQPPSGLAFRKVVFRVGTNETTRLRDSHVDKNETSENSTSDKDDLSVSPNMGLIFIQDNVKTRRNVSYACNNNNITAMNESNGTNTSESEALTTDNAGMRNETLVTSNYESDYYNNTNFAVNQDVMNATFLEKSTSNPNATKDDVIPVLRSNDTSRNLNDSFTA